MKVISIINPKGGAGKTVTAVNVAYALKNREKRVLLIDTDPRGAIATYLAIENKNTIHEAIKENYENLGMLDISKYIYEKNEVDVIVSNSKLSGKYEFFGKFFLTLYFKDGSLFLSIIYCKYESGIDTTDLLWR